MHPDAMVSLRSISSLLDVLDTPVNGHLMAKLVSDQALIGPDDDGYWENPRGGISVKSDDGIVTCIFLHAWGKDDFAQFPGPLPAGLTFDAGQEEVRRAFGEAQKSGGPGKMPRVFNHAGWDRFEVGNFLIHFTYRAVDRRIELVTLMPRQPANTALPSTGLPS
jgi:hypothetical protein